MQVDTERLHLRPLAMSDAAGLLRLQQDPVMMRYFDDGHPYGEQESRTWLEWHVAMWEQEGYGFWAVELRPDGELVGWLGVTRVWDPPELVSESELGWFVDRRHWGRGLATEGARAALDFAFGPLALPRVIARYHSENSASGRVMEKLGMRYWKDMPYEGRTDVTTRVYELPAPA